jgi:hypothetical protein
MMNQVGAVSDPSSLENAAERRSSPLNLHEYDTAAQSSFATNELRLHRSRGRR